MTTTAAGDLDAKGAACDTVAMWRCDTSRIDAVGKHIYICWYLQAIIQKKEPWTPLKLHFLLNMVIVYLGVSINRGTPNWMVKIMENPIKMDDLGVPLFLETPIYRQI